MSTQDIELKKSLLSPPGDTIQETIDEIGMSQAELAERLGRPKEKVNDLIKGREIITTDSAFRLEKVLGIPASFWLNREREFRQELYAIGQEEFLVQCQDWLKEFPIREMKKLGWITNTSDKPTLVDETLRFFGVASPKEWKRIYIAQEVSVAFRISLANTQSPQALSTWLRKGQLEAAKLELPEYNEARFKETLLEIKHLVNEFPENYAQQLQQKCAECGVGVVYVPNLSKAPVSGASRWVHGNPLIQLSGRYKTDDHFWFTFYHEAGHIMLHGKKDIFLENVKGTPIDEQKENEANAFAASALLSEKELDAVKEYHTWTRELFIELANKFNTSPGVIIGRLQHLGLVGWGVGNGLRQKVDLFNE
ncbi:MAG: ImmA/IrrE family metallo-endopeptidase [Salibacteraceae bacterium]